VSYNAHLESFPNSRPEAAASKKQTGEFLRRFIAKPMFVISQFRIACGDAPFEMTEWLF